MQSDSLCSKCQYRDCVHSVFRLSIEAVYIQMVCVQRVSIETVYIQTICVQNINIETVYIQMVCV